MTRFSVNFNDDLNDKRSGDIKESYDNPNFQGGRGNGVTPASNHANAGIELIALEQMNITHQKGSLQGKRWLKQTQSDIFHALELPQTRLAYLYHGFVFFHLFLVYSTAPFYMRRLRIKTFYTETQ